MTLLRFSPWFCLVMALALGACSRPSDPVSAARAFFEQIARGNDSAAYESTAEVLRAQQTLASFRAMNSQMELQEYRALENDPPVVDGRTARLRVEVIKADQTHLPLLMTLVQERGEWRVFAVRTPRDPETGMASNLFGAVGKGFAFGAGLGHDVPPPAELQAMVQETLLSFDAAIKAESFDAFYLEISRAWQREITAGRLRREFGVCIDRKMDFAAIQHQTPQYTPPPFVDAEGLLNVAGRYPTLPKNIVFSLLFTYEVPNWKLYGIQVGIVSPTGEDAPPVVVENPVR